MEGGVILLTPIQTTATTAVKRKMDEPEETSPLVPSPLGVQSPLESPAASTAFDGTPAVLLDSVETTTTTTSKELPAKKAKKAKKLAPAPRNEQPSEQEVDVPPPPPSFAFVLPRSWHSTNRSNNHFSAKNGPFGP